MIQGRQPINHAKSIEWHHPRSNTLNTLDIIRLRTWQQYRNLLELAQIFSSALRQTSLYEETKEENIDSIGRWWAMHDAGWCAHVAILLVCNLPVNKKLNRAWPMAQFLSSMNKTLWNTGRNNSINLFHREIPILSCFFFFFFFFFSFSVSLSIMHNAKKKFWIE